MIKYLSFSSFTDSEYELFLKSCPRKILIQPLKKIPKYKNHPLIKSFREEKIKLEVIIKFYMDDFTKDKKILNLELIKLIDKLCFKAVLEENEYKIIVDESDKLSSSYKQVVLKLLEPDKCILKLKYLVKLLDLPEKLVFTLNQKEKYDVLISENKKLTHEISKLNCEIVQNLNEKNNLIEEINKYKCNEKNLNNQINFYKESLEVLKNEKKAIEIELSQLREISNKSSFEKKDINLNKLLYLGLEKIENTEYSKLLELFNNLKLNSIEIEEIIDKISILKLEYCKYKKINDIKNLIILEYMIMNIMGEVNNE